MSTSTTQKVEAILSSQSYEQYCIVAAFTVYLFDYCIRMGEEIDCIWRRPFSLVFSLYTLLQAGTIAGFILLCYQNLVSLNCNIAYPEYMALVAVDIVNDATRAAISTLRVYAINPRDKLPAAAVLMLMLGGEVSFDIFEAVTTRCVSVPQIGGVVGSLSPGFQNYFIAAACTTITADAIILVVTWRNTYETMRLARQANVEVPLSSLLLRDGTLYFG